VTGPSNQPPDGIGFFVAWGVIEWALTGMATLGSIVAAWVWRLGSKTDKLEMEVDVLKQTLKEFEKKMAEDTQRLGDKFEQLTDKMDQLREQLPSRQFVESQINNLGQRIDNAMSGMSTRPR
jgi:Tfp pilus assembly protein PilO